MTNRTARNDMAVTAKHNGQRKGGIKMRYELSNETTIEKTDERQNEKTFGDYFSEFMTKKLAAQAPVFRHGDKPLFAIIYKNL